MSLVNKVWISLKSGNGLLKINARIPRQFKNVLDVDRPCRMRGKFSCTASQHRLTDKAEILFCHLHRLAQAAGKLHFAMIELTQVCRVSILAAERRHQVKATFAIESATVLKHELH